VLRSARDLLIAPVYVGAIVALGVAFRRRRADSAVLAIAAGAAAWIGLIMVMTEAGYSGNPRYLMLSAALVSVLGGVGFAWLGRMAARALPRAGTRSRAAAAAAAALVVCAASWPSADPRAHDLSAVARSLRPEAAAKTQLERLVARLGGRAAVLGCGRPTGGRFQRPILAWTLRVHARQVAFRLDDPGTPGLVLRVTTQRPADPPLPAAGPRYRPVADLGQWEALSAGCR
jgi:hypothetical protein